MKTFSNLFFTLFLAMCTLKTHAQMRTKNTTYLEFSGGIPLIFEGNQSFNNWKNGEKVFGLGLCFTNAKSNYHRIQLGFREEKVLDSPASYTNFQVKYLYESTILKGKYHRSFLGFLYGAGIGFESLKNSPNLNLTNNKTYPLLTVGLNFEKFVVPPVALFMRIEVDATTTLISQPIKANAQIGIKFSISNSN